MQSDIKDLYDLIIIGAGPNGLKLAIEAVKNNLNVLILEKDNICANFKKLGDDFVLANAFASELGIENVANGSITVKSFYEYYQQQVNLFKLEIIYNNVRQITKEKYFIIKTDNKEFLSKNVALAVGVYENPNSLDAPTDNINIFYHFPIEKPKNKKILIVGGANAAIKTVVDLYDDNEILWLSRNEVNFNKVFYLWKNKILDIVKNDSKLFRSDVKIHDIAKQKIKYTHKKSTYCFDFDLAFLLIGYRPDFSIVSNLINEKDKYIQHNLKNCQTNIKGLFVFGICAGKIFNKEEKTFFLEDGNHMAKKVIETIKMGEE